MDELARMILPVIDTIKFVPTEYLVFSLHKILLLGFDAVC